MANQNMPSDQHQERRHLEHEEEDELEEGWIDGRRSSQRIQMQRQRQREETEARPGPSGLQDEGLTLSIIVLHPSMKN